VFFRRMWRRLHDGDSEAATPIKDVGSSSQGERGRDPPPSASAAAKSPGLSAPDSASLLARSAKKSVEVQDKEGSGNGSPEQQCERVLLAIPEDQDWLSDMDCFIRNNIEVFSSTQSDVENAAVDRKYPIKIGQVGIRCIHCAMTSGDARVAAVSYPYSISGIYESVREFQRLHLDTCQNVPKDLKEASKKLGSSSASLSSVLRRYYVQAARALGLFDTHDSGIRAGGTPVPMSTAGFQSPAARPAAKDAPGTAPDTDRKRKAEVPFDEEGTSEPGLKRSKQEDAPGTVSEKPKQRDAPAKDELPGREDAPGEKAKAGVKEDAPEEKV